MQLVSIVLTLCSFVAPPVKDPHLKVTGTFEPAEAKPGQTVTLKLKVEVDDTWHTYPTTQLENAAKSFTNRIIFPEGGSLIFVGELTEPADPHVKAEPGLGIAKLHTYPSGGTWEKKVVVAPNAKVGNLETSIKLKVLICDKDECLPPKTIDVKAILKVAGDAVPVDPKYKSIVENLKK